MQARLVQGHVTSVLGLMKPNAEQRQDSKTNDAQCWDV
eukprot:CAMPEP_0206500450 /NCGR_PEP_ID=MMETSP0324_2-20121206/52469_1 /ASSEMBLY_ACC=CAM_ASM_000836 /TAXON_ID=2866 /ORGANISM="Crypthecodinium cohnii, Strain Seligo" /LENGTH=37 /DNA_ID= /DNA_START= /DNA_END= /DNA_ORIENTATION=